ncbi:MAG: sigma-70 family RNA polymerase sigma factor [Armatimonadetes bacterium]|nr:sigma-70 family RNA polymerase sigma factor [Armatimonadota bacterium]
MAKKQIVGWEGHLIQRAQEGELIAFELLSEIHRPLLMSQALRTLRNADDAQDAVQETLLKAMRAIKEFDSGRPIRPWLARICANCCMDVLRQRKRTPESIEGHEHLVADQASLEQEASARMERDQVVEAVNHLPETYRRIIFMRHFRHMDVNEIASALNTPEGTVKSWLFRARAQLRKELLLAS